MFRTLCSVAVSHIIQLIIFINKATNFNLEGKKDSINFTSSLVIVLNILKRRRTEISKRKSR